MEDEFDVDLFRIKTDGLHAPSNTVFDAAVTFNGPVYGLHLSEVISAFTVDGGNATTDFDADLNLTIDFGGAE